MDDTDSLHQLFDTAVSAAMPSDVVQKHLPAPPRGRVVIVGYGKASAAMASAAESAYADVEGLVIVPYGHRVHCERVEVVEAAHPVPDGAGFEATARLLELVRPLREEDLVLALVSGGGSALLVQPLPGVSLDQKRSVTQALLASGAPISEMNLVRTHLSRSKGGGVAAAAYPASVVALIISDVPGDDPAMIASGPTVAPRGTSQDALDVLDRRGIELTADVRQAIAKGSGRETVSAERLQRTTNIVIAAPQLSLDAAANRAVALGLNPLILGDALEGESREVGRVLAAIARQVALHDQPVRRPSVLLSGGETTVTLTGSGQGGPNTELLLAMAIALDGRSGITALACDTDGVDGAAQVAGAVITPETLARANQLGLEPRQFLMSHNAHPFFEALGDQVITGPTLTNVNDFRAVLIR
jgi:glycerate 2-kinase